MDKFIRFLIGLVLFVATVIFSGFVLQTLWGWFVVPLGIKALSLAHAVGVNILFGFIKYKYKRKHTIPDEEVFEPLMKKIGATITLGLLFLGVGYITVSFM